MEGYEKIGNRDDHLIEEFSELIKECSKLYRMNYESRLPMYQDILPIIEEMVDVEVMINQIKYGYILTDTPANSLAFTSRKVKVLDKVHRWLTEQGHL